MKKLILASFILLSFSAKGQTWVYHSFPESNASWNFEIYSPCTGIPPWIYEDYSITMTGDTVIGSTTYHKLFTPFVWNSYSGTGCEMIYPGYRGAIRQDSIAKKVFIVLGTTERLLYDFNMQVGDTVKGQMEYSSPPDTVVSIDSVIVGSTYRKRWLINQNNGIYLIEGVGSTYGLTVPSPGFAIGTFASYMLTCFSQNGSTLYPNTTTSCPLITSINSLETNSNQLTIFPNPSNGSFSIETKNVELKEIGISDLLGKEVFHQGEINQTKISVDGLNSGTYLLTGIDKENHSINKNIIVLPH